MKKALFIVIIIFFIKNSYCQNGNDKRDTNSFNKHTLSLHSSIDYGLSIYGYDDLDTRHPPKHYAYIRRTFPHNTISSNFNYSVGLKYYYNPKIFLGINTGVFFSKQAFGLGRTNPIVYKNRTYDNYDYYISYLYIPIGIKFSFLNKYFIRPNISFDLINGFLVNEKVHIHAGRQDIPLLSNKFRYYFLKPQITVGCDFYIKKKYKLDIEIVWRSRAFYHTDKALAPGFKFTNLCLGISFGYVIK